MRIPTKTDILRSRSVSLALRDLFRDRECFRNAGLLVARERRGWTYVEGYATAYGIAVHHAWAVDPWGILVDPTPSWADSDDWEPRGYFGVGRLAPVDLMDWESVPMAGQWPLHGPWGEAYAQAMNHGADIPPMEAMKAWASGGLSELMNRIREVEV